ncbi:sensor histidine kinase [Cryptosporangium sp. NPDC048952]|uniref:sensor histidine kinase n=1 Tax=Cryptosporangium sp. NPDC048952 TaxID=3363961 RepID=UPI003720629F
MKGIRALAYVVSGVGVGLLAVLSLLLPPAIRPLLALERRRLGLLGRSVPPEARVTRREVAYVALLASVLLVVNVLGTWVAVAVPGLLLVMMWVGEPGLFLVFPLALVLVIAWGVVTGVASGAGWVAESLLRPGTLTRSRVRLIDAFEVERRRIERDLHDGAQQRLVALSMTLGLAELERDDPETAHALVVQANEQASAALADLQALVRGIHPRVLTDLGLSAAIAELAEGCGVPLTVAVDVPDRLPAAVESTAYFVVAEALTNAMRHARPSHISVTGAVQRSTLTVEVRDDGIGGAKPGDGSGLIGLVDRVDARGGRLTLNSPRGGPTVLRMDLPCSA